MRPQWQLFFAAVVGAAVLTLLNYLYNRMIQLPLVMDGDSTPAFRTVALAFKELVESRIEQGASLAIYEADQPVLHMVAGYSDAYSSRPYSRDTLTFAMSLTELAAALCVAHLVSNGIVDYEDPVSKYWPEFSVNSKQNITVRQLLSHQAGLVGLKRPLTLQELATNSESVQQLLANQVTTLPIGSIAYHTLTYGLYVDHFVRKADRRSRSIARYFQQEIASPAGVEAVIGASRQDYHRIARVQHSPLQTISHIMVKADFIALKMLLRLMFGDAARNTTIANLNSAMYELRLNDPAVGTLPIATANLVSSAMQLARLFSLFSNNGSVHGKQLLQQHLLNNLTDLSLAAVTDSDPITAEAWACNCGFTLQKSPIGSTMIGKAGLGQMIWSDPVHKLTIVYVTNYLRFNSLKKDTIHNSILDAVYRVVAKRRKVI